MTHTHPMQNSKVFSLLSTLSKQELRDFLKFVQSDFFNRKKKVKSLLGIFVKSQAGKSITKSSVFKKLYPEPSLKMNFNQLSEADTKTIKTRIDIVMYELKIVLEDFLVWQQLKKDKISKKRLLLDVYQEKGIDKFFFEILEKLHVEYDKKKKNSLAYHSAKFDLYHLDFNHPKTVQHSQRLPDIDQMLYHLDASYIEKKISFGWIKILEGKLKKTEMEETPLINEVMNLVGDKKELCSPVVYPFFHALKSELARDYSLETYQKIKTVVLPEMEKYGYYHQIGLFNLLVNYCKIITLESQRGEEHLALEELLFLYNFGLETGYIFRDKHLSFGDFHGIVVCGCVTGKLDWTFNFIKKNQSFLKENIRQPMVKLCTAYVFLAQRKYKDCLGMLNSKTITISEIDKMYEKNIRTRCYYELGYTQLLVDWLEAYRKFLERNTKLSPYLVLRMKNFIGFVKSLIKLREQTAPIKQKSIQQIKDAMENSEGVLYKKWLLEKVDEFPVLRV